MKHETFAEKALKSSERQEEKRSHERGKIVALIFAAIIGLLMAYGSLFQ